MFVASEMEHTSLFSSASIFTIMWLWKEL